MDEAPWEPRKPHSYLGFLLEMLAGGAVVFALSGGFGLLVPPIENLYAICDQYLFQSLRLLLICLFGGFLLLGVMMRLRHGRYCRLKRVAAMLVLAVFLATGINLALRHDPFFAKLNWRVRPTVRPEFKGDPYIYLTEMEFVEVQHRSVHAGTFDW